MMIMFSAYVMQSKESVSEEWNHFDFKSNSRESNFHKSSFVQLNYYVLLEFL